MRTPGAASSSKNHNNTRRTRNDFCTTKAIDIFICIFSIKSTAMPSHQKARSSPKKMRAKPKKTKDLTAAQLVQAADQAVHVQDPVQALNLYTAAADKAKSSQEEMVLVDILEKRAGVKVSLADQEGALADYRECADLIVVPSSTVGSDSTGLVNVLERKAGLFLYMGQLSAGEDALLVYRNGIELLERALKLRAAVPSADSDDTAMRIIQSEIRAHDEAEQPLDPSTALQETRQKLAAAYCTAAELYLTDLCYEENAEQECDSYIQQALKLTDSRGEPIVDALQTTASLRLSQKRGMEAADFMLRAYNQNMREGCQALASLVGMRESAQPDQATELLETSALQNLPEFEFRCQTAKLLLECAAILKENGDKDRELQCLRASVDVLGSLMAENDEVIEIWNLAGDAFAAFNPSCPEVASHYWERALEMLNGVKKSLGHEIDEAADEEEEDEMNQELEEVVCQIDATKRKLGGIAIVSADAD